MTTTTIEKPVSKVHALKKLLVLILVFAVIIVSIVVIRSFPAKESEFVDSVAGEIAQEMAENQIVLSKKGGRRTVADFKDPIIIAHGKEARLIVYTAELSEVVSMADEGWGGFKWNSTYQEAKYFGQAEYTVDLSQLSEEDFIVNNEQKILTVRIPYAVLSPINILNDKTQFKDTEKGWLGPKEVKMTSEELNKIMLEVEEKMKAQLIDENIMAKANEEAKIVVAELLTATIQAVDPEFTVVVVF
jgi:hypothetical protein